MSVTSPGDAGWLSTSARRKIRPGSAVTSAERVNAELLRLSSVKNAVPANGMSTQVCVGVNNVADGLIVCWDELSAAETTMVRSPMREAPPTASHCNLTLWVPPRSSCEVNVYDRVPPL